MNSQELFSLLVLQKSPAIGDITAKRLLSIYGSATNILTQRKEDFIKISGFGEKLYKNLHLKSTQLSAEKELNYITNHKIKYWYYQDESYPKLLKHCVDGPILLFYSGNINLNKTNIISIVGTRNLTTNGAEFCNELIQNLSVYNPVIVSGLAYGADICAHQAAIKNNLQTVACLAHGLEHLYPKNHKKYISNIEHNGGLITDFWSFETPERNNFLKRNRIIAGLSQATLVIESAKKGGSLVTADIANSYNREVFAVPGKPKDIYSQGCNELIKHQKAQLITNASDIVKYLNWSEKTKKKAIQPQLFVELTTEEKEILNCFNGTPKLHLETLTATCNFPIHQLTSNLLTLELKGLVKALPGKYFERI